jgi:hypothetical protein
MMAFIYNHSGKGLKAGAAYLPRMHALMKMTITGRTRPRASGVLIPITMMTEKMVKYSGM